MKNEGDAALSPSDAAAKKRWMIGLVITVLFGSFAAVMAWLSYAGHDPPSPASGSKPSPSPSPSPSTPTPTPDPPDTPDTKGRGKGHNK